MASPTACTIATVFIDVAHGPIPIVTAFLRTFVIYSLAVAAVLSVLVVAFAVAASFIRVAAADNTLAVAAVFADIFVADVCGSSIGAAYAEFGIIA